MKKESEKKIYEAMLNRNIGCIEIGKASFKKCGFCVEP